MAMAFLCVGRFTKHLRTILAIPATKLQAETFSDFAKARVRVSKDPTLADEPFRLWIEGLRPRQKITLHASTRLPNAAIQESISHYVANENGIVSLDRDRSLGGSYTGVEPMGPLSFLTSSPTNKKKHVRFLIKDPTKPFTVDFRLFESFVERLDEANADFLREFPPSLTITRRYMSPGIREHPVWEGRVRGTLYLPAGDGPFPGVISMSGGYPGAMKHKAALLASHGFAAIALKYFGEDDLPDVIWDIDINYIADAAEYLKNHPKVNGKNGVGIIANCYGATVGLGLASTGPKNLIRSVVAINGWCFPFGTFTYNGRKLHGEKPHQIIEKRPDGVTKWKYFFACSEPHEDPLQVAEVACFPFHKRHETSYMFVVGSKDGYFPTNRQTADFVTNLLRASGHPNYEILFYPGAGHLIEHSFHPFHGVAWTLGELHDTGGEQPHHSKAQIDSWPKILEFTRKNLMQ